MMGLAGFDFQSLNRKYLAQPANDAANYGVSILHATGLNVWRCIGVYHLRPEENRGRRNIFIECLDEKGVRTQDPAIAWTWWIDTITQIVKLDKPTDEPAADIPIGKAATITLRVGGALPSDSVGNLHTRHADEAGGNTYGHHSFYVVFQLQGDAVITPPVIDPPTEPLTLTLEQRVAALERRVTVLERNCTSYRDA